MEKGLWGRLGLGEEVTQLKRALAIRVYFEGSSDWTTREYIDIIDEYLMERLPVMINNVLEPYGAEASILEDKTACDILGDYPGCENTIVVEIYTTGSTSPSYFAIYYRRKGDNTYEFYLEKVLKKQ